MSCTADILISRRKNEPTHYMLKIDCFSLLSESSTTKIESDVFEASGHKWRLDLYPSGNEEEKGSKHISLYVIICDTESLPKKWEVCADVNFFIYDHNQHNYATFQDIVNGNRKRFNEKKMKWGFDKLVSLESFTNRENGYLANDDSCVFGAEILAVTEYAQKDRCLSIIKPPTIMNTYTWTIDNFSSLIKGGLYSDIFKVCKVNWKLYARSENKAKVVGDYLAIYLVKHDAALLSDGWRVYAKYKLRLKNQSDNDVIERELDHWFYDSSVSWGFATPMLLSKLNDPEKGVLLNGSFIVEAEFSLVGMINNFI